MLSYDALADDVPADHIVDRVMQTVPLPDRRAPAAAPRAAAASARPAGQGRRLARHGPGRDRDTGAALAPHGLPLRPSAPRRRWPGCSC